MKLSFNIGTPIKEMKGFIIGKSDERFSGAKYSAYPNENASAVFDGPRPFYFVKGFACVNNTWYVVIGDSRYSFYLSLDQF